MLAALLAIQKAGAAYVPLDPSYPSERIAFILEDAGAKLLVTQDSLRGRAARRPARNWCASTPTPTTIAAQSDAKTSRPVADARTTWRT